MKYRFKIDEKKLSAEKIDKHKDFKRLRANYDEAVKPLYKRPLYKDKKAFIVILIIALLAYLLSEAYKEDEQEQKKVPPTEQVE
jgi:hypothetical protein